MKNLKLLFSIIVCFVNISISNGVHIKFYQYPNFSGSYFESESAVKCTNFKGNMRAEIGSISTDTCVVVYGFPNCKGPWSKKFVSSKPNFLKFWLWNMGSFHVCNSKEGGSRLNVDITNYFKDHTIELPPTIKRYKNICSCVNVPTYVQQMDKWSINNHHNELIAYSEPDCTEVHGKARRILAGRDVESREMGDYNSGDRTWKKTMSFGPNPNALYYQKTCLKQMPKLDVLEEQQMISLINNLDTNIPFSITRLANWSEFHFL